MPIIKEGKEVADQWHLLNDDDPLPGSKKIIVSLERWNKEKATLLHCSDLGIHLRSDQPPSLIGDDLEHFKLIQLNFPKFGDGRAYSYARILREEIGYRGEIRASGNVLRDQYLFMLRCGFDSVEVVDPARVPGFAQAMQEFSVFYQPAADRRKPIWALRHQR